MVTGGFAMKRLFVSAVAWSCGAAALFAQANITSATAANVPWGQTFNSAVSGTSQFWYRLHIEQPRSYCVETAQPTQLVYADKFIDTILDVFADDGTTLIVHNDDTSQEPYNYNFSRACFVAPFGAGDIKVKLTNFSGGDASTLRIRFLETTLFCPWFFVAGDYNAFSLIKNTSDAALNGIVVTWNGLNGVQAGTTTVNIPANGTAILNARDFVNPATFSNGSITIAHPGSPEQIVGSTTTLSGTTGLGFDAVFTQREPW
jgi:hypothetical protein